MNTARKTRWLQVAKRASEFRVLQGSSEVAEATQRADAALATLEASQHLRQQSQSAWREHLSKPVFHAGDDAQFRHFQGVLREAELGHNEAAKRARSDLEIMQLALRMQLAEKNALQAAVNNLTEVHRLEETRAGQKEIDDVWSVTQYKPGATP
jgi:hypothetical protein